MSKSLGEMKKVTGMEVDRVGDVNQLYLLRGSYLSFNVGFNPTNLRNDSLN